MTFQDVADALIAIADDEELKTTDCLGKPTIRSGNTTMGLVACGTYDLSFYYKVDGQPGLLICSERNVDAALSRGLDFIYS